jgi:hypothetical protein
MFILSTLGILVGLLLGGRFTVFVLAPVTCAVLAFVVIAGIAQGNGLWWSAFEMIAIATSVQFGYLLGVVAQSVMGSVRGGNQGTTPLANRPQNWSA